MAVAEINNIIIDKGTDFEATFNLFESDSSVASLSQLGETYARIRKYPESANFEEFSKTITTGTGTIRLTLTAEQTARLTNGRNYFDVILTINNRKVKVIQGTAIINESVSL